MQESKALSSVSQIEQPANLKNLQNKTAYYLGRILQFIPSWGVDLISSGIENIKNRTLEDSKTKKFQRVSLGLVSIAGGGIVTGLLGIPYLIGNKLQSIGEGEFRVLKGKAISSQQTNNPTQDVKIFDMNTALGHKFIRAANFGGTEFTKTSNKERAEEILKAAIQENPDVITFQENFDPDVSEYMAKELNEKGYDVVFNVGHSVDGYAGYNSGLLTGVKRSFGTIEDVAFKKYSRFENEEKFAAKGALHTKIRLNDGRVLFLTNTHLQASGDNEIAIRNSQIQELTSSLESFSTKGNGQQKHMRVICGDFNDFDPGHAQVAEWLGRPHAESAGEEVNNETFLKEFSLATQTLEDQDGFDMSLVSGSGIEKPYFGKKWESLKGNFLDSARDKFAGFSAPLQTERQFADAVLRQFIARQANYYFDTGLEQIQLDNVHGTLVKGAVEMENKRKRDIKFRQNVDLAQLSSQELMKILLLRRSREELIAEGRILQIEQPENYSDSLLIDKIVEKLKTIFSISEGKENDEISKERLQQILQKSFYRNRLYQIIERKLNDHILMSDGLQGNADVQLNTSHLSDHLGVVANIHLPQPATQT